MKTNGSIKYCEVLFSLFIAITSGYKVKRGDNAEKAVLPKAVECFIRRFHHHPVDKSDEPGARRSLSRKPLLPEEKSLVRRMPGEEGKNGPDRTAELVGV